ncbi:MAG: nucleotide sugar dehydrogenase [bacterium]|nr:nucleotide sugar dehydrogenase [bacterium]
MALVYKDLSKICVNPSLTIGAVLSFLASNKTSQTLLPAGIALVVGPDKKLLGIATDGDIRRGLSEGASLGDSITKIMNSNPFLIEGPLSNNEILLLIANKIKKENWHKDRLNKIVVVDKDRRVMDLVSFYDLWQKSDNRFKQIGVVGLGYVGLTLALTLADLGFKVKGYDNNLDVIKKIKSGKPHFFEKGLKEILSNNLNNNFDAVTDFLGANNCDIYFIAVGTPLAQNKKPSLDHLKSASETIGKVLKSGDTVILRSTVPVGTTRGFVIPILEKTSGLKSGEDFFVAFAPERTVEGKALEELRKLPQIVGGLNWASADITANIFNHLTHSVVLVDSLEEAEMVKLVNNTYRDVVFSFANELSLICNKWGMNTRRVIEAANNGYERSNVPMPSPGVGGVCLEKDPLIFIESAKKKKYQPLLARDSRKISDLMINFVAGEINKFIKDKKDSKVFIMGLAFKGRPVTSDIRGSTSISLIEKIKNSAKSVLVYDPAVNLDEVKKLGIKMASPLEGFKKADVVVVMNNNLDFEKLDIKKLLKTSNNPVFVFDTWAVFNQNDLSKLEGVIYKHL